MKYPKDLAKRLRKYLVEKKEDVPDLSVLEKLFEILFFASLYREETQPISCRVAFIDPEYPDPKPPSAPAANRWGHFPLLQKLELSVANLVKISQAVDPWGSTLAVHSDKGGHLWIWGLIDQSVHFSAYLVKEFETGPEMPGMFQAAITGVGEISAYKRDVLVGELKRDVLITRQHRVFQSGPLYEKLVPWIERSRVRVFEKVDPKDWREYWHRILGELWVSALSRLLIGIQRYGHGGAVLISDCADGLTPKYTLSYPRLTDALIRLGVHHINNQFYADRIIDDYVTRNIQIPPMTYLNESVESMRLKDTKDELKGCIRFLTSLSRVDGLLWIDPNLELKAFGVEIAEQQDPPEVSIARYTDGSEPTKITLSRYGMRHRSMVRYCGFNPNAVGFVVSQDGGLKAITKIDDSVVIWDKVRIHSLLTPRSSDRRRDGRT